MPDKKPSTIYERELSNGELLRIEESRFKGKQYLSIRRWYKVDRLDGDTTGTEWMPGKNGINVELGPDFSILCEGLEAVLQYSHEPGTRT